MEVDIILSDFLFLKGCPSRVMKIKDSHFGANTDGIVFSAASSCSNFLYPPLNDKGWKVICITSKSKEGKQQDTYIALEENAADELFMKWEDAKGFNNGTLAIDRLIPLNKNQIAEMLKDSIFKAPMSGWLGSQFVLPHE